MSITVTGRIEKVFHAGSGWSSILIAEKNGGMHRAAGKIDSPIAGYDITVIGEIDVHEKYGEQIKVASSTVCQATSADGILKYLVDQLDGIGPKLAEKIVDTFGSDTLRIIEEEPGRLIAISGISESKAKKIIACHKENKVYLELTEFFGEYATVNQIKKIYEEFKKEGINKIRKNPYIIIYRVDGIGFNIADKLALSSGIKPDDPHRLAAAIVYILKNIAAEGHCFCRIESLESMLRDTFKTIPIDKISDVLVKEINADNLVLVDEDKLYWKEIYEAERDCAVYIKEMLESAPVAQTTSAIVDEAITEFEEQNGFTLVYRQKDAINMSMRNRFSVITGGPGSGKTTIIKGLIQAWRKAHEIPFREVTEDKVSLCAPTGKAARRMAELTGMEASTLHRFIFHGRIIEKSLIVVDEASMLDILLAARLLRIARENSCQVVLVGDADQLSPIGPGNFFKDILQSPRVPDVMLDVTHRNSGTIAKNAKKINNGIGPAAFEFDDSFDFIQVDKSTAKEAVVKSYLSLVDEYGPNNVLCAVPMRKKGKSQTASETLNELIREQINPYPPGAAFLAGCFFRVNDRVMYLENSSEMEISNGDCGIVSMIDLAAKRIHVDFDCGKKVAMTVEESKNMTLAYAMSIHKAQGSEFKAVVVTQCWEDYYMLNRSLFYTAVTRARDKVVLIGDTPAIQAALRNIDAKLRNTRLKNLLGMRVVI